jgi:hypothetical protein
MAALTVCLESSPWELYFSEWWKLSQIGSPQYWYLSDPFVDEFGPPYGYPWGMRLSSFGKMCPSDSIIRIE